MLVEDTVKISKRLQPAQWHFFISLIDLGVCPEKRLLLSNYAMRDIPKIIMDVADSAPQCKYCRCRSRFFYRCRVAYPKAADTGRIYEQLA